jgi:hypothetical protein
MCVLFVLMFVFKKMPAVVVRQRRGQGRLGGFKLLRKNFQNPEKVPVMTGIGFPLSSRTLGGFRFACLTSPAALPHFRFIFLATSPK